MVWLGNYGVEKHCQCLRVILITTVVASVGVVMGEGEVKEFLLTWLPKLNWAAYEYIIDIQTRISRSCVLWA